MRRTLLKGKIHRATITEARLDYVGCLGIDRRLIKLAGIVPNEMVHVVNVNAALARRRSLSLRNRTALRKHGSVIIDPAIQVCALSSRRWHAFAP